MKKLSFFMILISGILCISFNALAAQMRYSFTFEVGSATFDGNTLDPASIVTVDLYGDTGSIIIPDILTQDLSGLPGYFTIDSIGTYVLAENWRIVCQQSPQMIYIGQSDSPLPFAAFGTYGARSLFDEFTILDTMPIGFSLNEGCQFNTTGGIYMQNVQDGSFLSFTSTVVPIPSAIWLLGSGVIGLVGLRKKIRKA